MFKTALPAGQPRSLRTIAEQKNKASNFISDGFQNLDMADSKRDYADEASGPQLSLAGRRLTAADKNPFNWK